MKIVVADPIFLTEEYRKRLDVVVGRYGLMLRPSALRSG